MSLSNLGQEQKSTTCSKLVPKTNKWNSSLIKRMTSLQANKRTSWKQEGGYSSGRLKKILGKESTKLYNLTNIKWVWLNLTILRIIHKKILSLWRIYQKPKHIIKDNQESKSILQSQILKGKTSLVKERIQLTEKINHRKIKGKDLKASLREEALSVKLWLKAKCLEVWLSWVLSFFRIPNSIYQTLLEPPKIKPNRSSKQLQIKYALLCRMLN